jgi:hypothetical protein
MGTKCFAVGQAISWKVRREAIAEFSSLTRFEVAKIQTRRASE